MDNQLFERENLYKNYKNKFNPLFNQIIPEIDQFLFPTDYLAWMFASPIEALPQDLQITTYEEYAYCINKQCMGAIEDINRNIIPRDTEIYSSTFVYFIPQGISPLPTQEGIPYHSSNQINVVLHEYAHYLGQGEYVNSNPLYPHYGMINTNDFHNISFNLDWNEMIESTAQTACFPLITPNIEDFISYYSYDQFPNITEEHCPQGMSSSWNEDFANSFAYYVTAGKDFRNAVTQNTTIEEKYNWLKDNVFQGIEYDTELVLINGTYSGCTDGETISYGPGYLSCNENFVWNGTLPKVEIINKIEIPPEKIPSSKIIPFPIIEKLKDAFDLPSTPAFSR